MFRIHFDETQNHFVVQVLRYGILWRTVKGLDFDTLRKAREYVSQVGLDQLYRDKSADKYHAYMAEGNNMRRLMV